MNSLGGAVCGSKVTSYLSIDLRLDCPCCPATGRPLASIHNPNSSYLPNHPEFWIDYQLIKPRESIVSTMEVKSDALDTGAGFYTLNDASLVLHSVFTSLKTFLSKLPLYQLIRLAWIIGGYILLRPYIELGLRKLFAGQEEHASDTVGAADITPPPQDFSASGMNNEAAVGRTAWGAAARKRKVMIRQAWEEEQARLAEEHDLDGIDPDLLED
jgi:hypothetical protein